MMEFKGESESPEMVWRGCHAKATVIGGSERTTEVHATPSLASRTTYIISETKNCQNTKRNVQQSLNCMTACSHVANVYRYTLSGAQWLVGPSNPYCE